MQAVLKALIEIAISSLFMPEDVVATLVGSTPKETNVVSFSDIDLPSKGRNHTKALYIKIIVGNA